MSSMPSPTAARTKQITIRSVDPKLDAALKREARRRSMSVNQTILTLLRGAIGLRARDGRVREHDDLDALAGTWDEDEARDFDRDLASQRRVDRKLWR